MKNNIVSFLPQYFLTLFSVSAFLILQIYYHFQVNARMESVFVKTFWQERNIFNPEMVHTNYIYERMVTQCLLVKDDPCGPHLLRITLDFLYFDEEGISLILRGKDNSTVWQAPSKGLGKELVLQDDGKLVLYNSCNTSIWEIGNNKKCREGLLCLFNAEFLVQKVFLLA